MNLRVKLSLKLKIFVSFGIFYLAAVGSLTFLTIRSQRNLLLAQMAERAKAGINLLELSVTGALYKLDTFRLETIAREASALPNVDYAYIFDAQGRIVGDYHEDQRQLFSTFTDELGKRIIKSNETVVDTEEKNGILDISKPVKLGHEKLGGIRLGFDLKPIEQEIEEATYRAVAVASTIFVIGLAVLFGITMKMTKPIERLTVAAKRIETGELDYRVRIERDDEIGALATAFDQMGERLGQRGKELKETQNTPSG